MEVVNGWKNSGNGKRCEFKLVLEGNMYQSHELHACWFLNEVWWLWMY